MNGRKQHLIGGDAGDGGGRSALEDDMALENTEPCSGDRTEDSWGKKEVVSD